MGRYTTLCRSMVRRPDGRRMGIHPFPHPDLYWFRPIGTAQYNIRYGRYLRRKEIDYQHPGFSMEDIYTHAIKYGRLGCQREVSPCVGRTCNVNQPLVSETQIGTDALCLQYCPRICTGNANDTCHVPGISESVYIRKSDPVSIYVWSQFYCSSYLSGNPIG